MNNPVGTRRQKQKAETREVILDSARKLFEAKGFEKTTMRGVAINADIGLGTIYKHFANKSEMLAAALLGDLTRLYDGAMAGIPLDVSVKQQFIHISRQFYAYYISNPDLARAYLKNLFSMDASEIDQINKFDEIHAEKVTALVAAAQHRGEISPDRDCGFVAMSIIADYFYVLATCLLRYNETDLEKMLGILEKMLDQTLS
jgi:AcrR family transcriptional regulator